MYLSYGKRQYVAAHVQPPDTAIFHPPAR